MDGIARYCYGYLNATAKALKSVAARKEMSPLRVAVIVHAYYPELWPEISNLLKSWEARSDFTSPFPPMQMLRSSMPSAPTGRSNRLNRGESRSRYGAFPGNGNPSD